MSVGQKWPTLSVHREMALFRWSLYINCQISSIRSGGLGGWFKFKKALSQINKNLLKSYWAKFGQDLVSNKFLKSDKFYISLHSIKYHLMSQADKFTEEEVMHVHPSLLLFCPTERCSDPCMMKRLLYIKIDT